MARNARSSAAVVLAATAVLSVGCTRPLVETTQIVVEVSSDLLVPLEIDAVRLAITGKTATVTHTILLSAMPTTGRSTLPFTLTLVPAGATNEEFTVDATALFRPARVVAQNVTTAFVPGEARLVRIALNRVCIGVSCSAALTTCAAGKCVSQKKLPSELPPFVPPDAGTPDGVKGDGGADAQQPDLKPPQYFVQNLNNDIDIVFMVDNSSSMEEEQQNLSRNFPTFMNVLKALPAGLPDVHIGVVSSSLGAGAFSDVPGCPMNGDRGAFQNVPRASGGACTTVPRDGYIISLGKGTMNNFTGDIADVFKCIAELGSNGCGFEHQLASVRRALGGDPAAAAPGQNNGFLRDNALLAVILITDEDDCSAPADSDLFDTKQSSTADPLGPLSSYRCAEFGHLCGSAKPPRQSAMNLTDCHSAEDNGKLVKVSEFVEFFKTVKPLPNMIITAAIAGPPMPYNVQLNGQRHPEMGASCTSTNGAAYPGVRIKEFVDAFGQNGSFTSICMDNLNSAIDRIAKEIGKRFGAQCLDGLLVDKSSTMAGLQADCEVFDQIGSVTTPLPSCDVGSPPCWRLVQNSFECTTSGHEIQVDRVGAPAPANTVLCARCETCMNTSDPRCQ